MDRAEPGGSPPSEPVEETPWLAQRVERFDQAVDRMVDPLRGNPVADGLAYGASALGDRGLVWLLIGLARSCRPARRRSSLRAVALTGAVTPILNLVVKAVIERPRPETRHAHPLPVRIPRTASFPSGHALAAWCAATLLAEDDPFAPAYYGLAIAISASRVHVRLHHASDVIGGAGLGIAVASLIRVLSGTGPAARRNADGRPAVG
jgi:undecaprenyl-diphosphatase